RHRFDLHDAWHNWVAREMSLEEWLVDSDGFNPNAFGFRIETDDPIDHQEREAVRQNLHHLIGVESAVAGWNRTRYSQSASSRLFARDQSSQIRITRVTWFYRDHMPANTSSDQSEIADDIEDFVTDKFIGKPQRLLA